MSDYKQGLILLVTKKNDWCQKAIQLAKYIFGESNLIIKQGEQIGEKLPELSDSFEIIISFLSPWIVPQKLLNKARIAINFHPGSREYPGMGCYNFAIYEKTKMFGATCHYMKSKVDSGDIIIERRFEVEDHETIESLKYRTMIVMLALFHEVMGMIRKEIPLPKKNVSWSREPFTRAQLEDLCVINRTMTEEEVKRRVRACHFPGYPDAKINIGGIDFLALVK